MKTVSKSVIKELRRYDSPTVCNVIELFKVRPQNKGFLHHAIRALFPELPPMVGHAVTITFRSAKPGRRPAGYNEIATHVEALLAVPPPRVVVFQDLDDEPVGATFGEMLATTYRAFGCVGIITSGGARDTEAIRRMGLPLFARERCVSHGYPQYLAVNTPVRVGGVRIMPGDLLHGDGDGVTTVPNVLAPQIARMCAEFIAAERHWVRYVTGRHPTAEGVGVVIARQRALLTKAMKDIAHAHA